MGLLLLLVSFFKCILTSGLDDELCVLSVAPRRLLRVRDIASFEVSQPARFAGIKRAPTGSRLPEVRSGPL